jgi:hypothetical protein
VAVFFCVSLSFLGAVVRSVVGMSACNMGVVRGLLVEAGRLVLGSLPMVLGSMLVMFRRLGVMFRRLL